MRLRPEASLDRVMQEVCRYYHFDEKDFLISGKDRELSEARWMAGWLVMELGVGTLSELSRRTGRDVTTLSAGVKRLQIRSKTDFKLSDATKSLLTAVS